MDSLTWRGCVTLWKSESSLDYRPPRVEERASKSGYLPKTGHRTGHRKTLVSVNARGFGCLQISGNYLLSS